MVVIRQESVKDYTTVYYVVKRAFETAVHSDGREQDLVVALRNSKSFVPELSLVAEIDDRVVGYILFTEAYIGNERILVLAPLAVAPAYQCRGIGLALINEGHRKASVLGYGCSVALGDPLYYSKSGYIPASRYHIASPFDVPDENFMAVKLKEIDIHGVVQYDEVFGL